jgi:hypothetical protein
VATAPTRDGWFSRLLGALTSNLPGGDIALVAITVALLGGLVVGLRTARGRRDGGLRRAHGQAIGPVLSAFHRLTRHPDVPAPRAPSETAREYLARIATLGTVIDTVETLEQECYGAAPPPPDEAAAAVARLDQLLGASARR